jgi:hypothetical protein
VPAPDADVPQPQPQGDKPFLPATPPVSIDPREGPWGPIPPRA